MMMFKHNTDERFSKLFYSNGILTCSRHFLFWAEFSCIMKLKMELLSLKHFLFPLLEVVYNLGGRAPFLLILLLPFCSLEVAFGVSWRSPNSPQNNVCKPLFKMTTWLRILQRWFKHGMGCWNWFFSHLIQRYSLYILGLLLCIPKSLLSIHLAIYLLFKYLGISFCLYLHFSKSNDVLNQVSYLFFCLLRIISRH